MIVKHFTIHNVDRALSAPFGGDPCPEHDRGVVWDNNVMEQNLLTGARKPAILFRGTIVECHAWVKQQLCAHAGESGIDCSVCKELAL